MRRTAQRAGLAGLALLTVAGCTTGGGDADGDPSSTSPSGSSSTAATGSSSGGSPTGAGTSSVTGVPPATNSPTAGTSSGAVTGPAVPADPAVPDGAAGAYTLVVTGGGAVTVPVAQVSCQQDGSLTADGLELAAGGSSLRFVDVAPVGTLDVPGRADLTAAGGVFRGSTPTAAVAFTWTC